MNHKVTLAVSAALMSMSVHSASELSRSNERFTIELNEIKAATAISVNKGVNSAHSQVKDRFTIEKDLSPGTYTYIVQLENAPIAQYDGDLAGYAATNPLAVSLTEIGQHLVGKNKIDTASPEVRAYSSLLETKQNQFVESASAKLGSLEIVKKFKFAINGFAVKLTQEQAAKLSNLPGVKHVEREQTYFLNTDAGPTRIGAPSVWDGSAVDSGTGSYGEGVIVGIFDTGINSDHPSFADVAGDGYDHTNPFGEGVYVGDCAAESPTIQCNDKLIGVRSYPSITDAYDDDSVFPPGLAKNGEDYNGHGSHVASTAAGNILVDVPLYVPEDGVEESDGIATPLVFSQISGVAPRANIIAYQVCRPGNRGDSYAGCSESAILAAQEDAIADGIDVVNHSIGPGPGQNLAWTNAGEVGFLSMRNAGIFVATSAGNDGSDPGTTSKQAPWYTAVAASTHGRVIATPKELTDFSGGDTTLETISGSSNSGGITASIVYAGDFENPNDPGNDPAQCFEPFPEGTFNGEIVVCDRGVIARVAKAQNVAAGGAGGFVLANVDGGSDTVASDYYVVPGIHIDIEQGNLLRDWLASGEGHQATITAADASITYDENSADQIIGFSSRGPNLTISALSPWVAAPGVDIYAATNDQDFGKDVTGPAPSDFGFLSGTSMASPHVAGAGALLTAVHPTWTPDQIRSALMMTATPSMLNAQDGSVANWFDMGSGRVQINAAVQSGLVMDESAANYAAANPLDGGDPKTLNIPSLTDDDCLGICTWTRTVTATKAGTWSVEGVSITEGLEISISPVSFELAEGESQVLTITADGFNAPSGDWSFGLVRMTSDTSPDLHLPVSVIATTGNIPELIEIEAHRNKDSFLLKDITAVEITDFTVTSYGFAKASLVEGELLQDSVRNNFLDDLEDGVSITTVDITEGTKRFVSEIVASEAPDLDLFVLIDANDDGIPTIDELVDSSATETAFEKVDIVDPQAGSYWIIVQNWRSSTEGASDAFTMAYARIDGSNSESLSVLADSAVPQLTPFDIRFAYDLGNGAIGDYFYGAAVLGTSAEKPDNLGLLPVDLVRGANDVNVVGNLTDRLNPGDQFTYSVAVDANFRPEDRTYDINVTLPEGVTLVDSGSATVEGNALSWTLTQESLYGVFPTYTSTSNATDAMCRNPEFTSNGTPINPGGSYLDLSPFAGFDSELQGLNAFGAYLADVSFLGEDYGIINVGTNGTIMFATPAGDFSYNQLMPDVEAPNGLLSPYWRYSYIDNGEGSGVTVFPLNSFYTIVEWDDVQTVWADGGVPVGDMADFQVIFSRDGYVYGEPDIIFSYDNVVHNYGDVIPTSIGYEDGNGETGLTTHYSPRSFNPAEVQGSIEADIANGTQICLWYQPVPNEPTLLSFTVEVNESNLGGALEVMAMSTVVGDEFAGTEVSLINSNIEVEGPPVALIDGMVVADLSVVELTELDLPGTVTEPNGDEVEILWKQVSGPAAVIAGNGLAEAILMAPEVTEDSMVVLEMTATDSNGNSVTATANVMVMNNLPPEIAVSAPTSVVEGDTIRVTVSTTDNEGDAVTVTINGVEGTTYTTVAPATNSDTSVSFEVVATDGLNTTTEVVSVQVRNKKAGSMGWIALLLVPVVWLRRRKTTH